MEVFQADTTVEEALERARSSEFRAWPVSDRSGVLGVVSLRRLRQGAGEGWAGKPLREVVGAGDFPHVHIDHPLHVALDRMGASQLELLPVVSRANVRQLMGVVTLEDILARYGVGRAAENLPKGRD
jgi:CIC family chloride channel protein